MVIYLIRLPRRKIPTETRCCAPGTLHLVNKGKEMVHFPNKSLSIRLNLVPTDQVNEDKYSS